MSARKLSLRDPAVIAVVAVLLVAVAAVNLRTFGPKGPGHRQVADRSQAQSSLPEDLGELVRSAGARQRGQDPAPVAQAGPTQAFVRDPFTAGGCDAGRKPAAATVSAPAARPRPVAAQTLVCSAVLLGGPQPAALIGGKPYAPGQRVGRYEVVDVTLQGATLRDQDGGTVFLKVMDKPGGTGSFQVTGGCTERTE